MRKIKFLLVFCVVMFCNSVLLALDIDEKLSSRILRISSTKKTMLLNRGSEDGLVVGDHAKFYITTGVIARGVVMKVSPTRSIWALYRLVNPQELVLEAAINLKIASAVKLSNDPTRMFGPDRYLEGMPIDGDISIGSPEGAIPVEHPRARHYSPNERKDSWDFYAGPYYDKNQMVGGYLAHGVNLHRSNEVWAIINFSVLNVSTDSEQGEDSRSDNWASMFGFEKYFTKRGAWYYRFSMNLLLNYAYGRSGTSDASVSESLWEFGLGVNYHFSKEPLSYNKFIWYTGFNYLFGRPTKSNDQTDSELSGSSTRFFIPFGIKYYWVNGWGMRAHVTYSSETRSYSFENYTTSETISGINGWAVGVGYRF